jgi:SRSO17 transposase
MAISTSRLTIAQTLPANIIHEDVQHEFQQLAQRLEKHFLRTETRISVLHYLEGLLSTAERKNSWQLAEQAGMHVPYAFQYLLGRALWKVNALRDDTLDYTLDFLGEEQGTLSIDETGFLKKGTQSAGVSRQYSGTAGRIENCQIGVFLSYATARGRALLDRELYIPVVWFKDKQRCHRAGIPEDVTFKTKPELAKAMLKRVFASGLKPTWVVGDEIYGCYALRAFLEEQQQSYILAVASNYCVTKGFQQYRVNALLQSIRQQAWHKLSAGKGSKGERYYEWYRMKINSMSPKGWQRWLVFRRNLADSKEIAFYIAFSRKTVTLAEKARTAGSRWAIEECFEMAKGEVGLDHYEVRSWTGWYRHVTLSMLALSFLSRLRYQLNQSELVLFEKKVTQRKNPMKAFLQNRGLS